MAPRWKLKPRFSGLTTTMCAASAGPGTVLGIHMCDSLTRYGCDRRVLFAQVGC